MPFKQATLTGYVSRDEKLTAVCRGKRVLHLGCVGFTDCPVEDKVRLARQSLHQRLSDVSTCVGIDLDAESIRQLQARGVFNNVLVGNAERLEDLPAGLEPFDVVVAGDIIEHLSNPGRMLDGARARLTPEGCLALSTPNAFGLPNYTRHFLGTFQEGRQHVLTFNAITLTQLLERHGYRVTEALSCHQNTAAGRHGWMFGAGKALMRRFPKHGGTLLFMAQPVSNRAFPE